MKIEIFIAASGGVVNTVRGDVPNDKPGVFEWVCHLVDYDEFYTDGADAPYPGTVEDFEREKLGGRTWAEIEQISEAVL
jgi:hypothetical protein